MLERLAAEQYDSIPGVPEPAENPNLVGHAEEARLLAGAYRTGRLHHAILLAGPLGIGKATIVVYSDNAEGQAFWRATGWVTRDDLLVMQRATETR